jgi:uncharacterized protein
LRLVLDTNIWVSAFLTPGGMCEKLVRAHHPGHLQFLVSKFILREIGEVLGEKLGMPASLVDKHLKYVIRHSLLVSSCRPSEAASRGRLLPAQIHWESVECAVSGRASYLVTGDKSHLLSLGRFEGVELVTPRRMMDILNL